MWGLQPAGMAEENCEIDHWIWGTELLYVRATKFDVNG